MIYQVGLGHNLALIDLDPIVQQPSCPDGVQPASVEFGADATRIDAGLFCRLEFQIVESETAIQALYTQFGFGANNVSAVTIYLPNFQRTATLYNGYAVRPITTNFQFWGKNLRITIRDLVGIS